MKFAQHFDLFRQSFWMCLLVAALLISAPLRASEEEPSVSGKIAAIDVVGRVIEIDGARYTLALQAEIQDVSSEASQAISIIDLKVGQQVVEFEASGNVIRSLRVFARQSK